MFLSCLKIWDPTKPGVLGVEARDSCGRVDPSVRILCCWRLSWTDQWHGPRIFASRWHGESTIWIHLGESIRNTGCSFYRDFFFFGKSKFWNYCFPDFLKIDKDDKAKGQSAKFWGDILEWEEVQHSKKSWGKEGSFGHGWAEMG